MGFAWYDIYHYQPFGCLSWNRNHHLHVGNLLIHFELTTQRIVLLTSELVINSPVRAIWTYPAMEGQKCLNATAWWQAAGVLNTASEFVTALLPILGAFTFNVATQQRWHVISLLSVGFIVAIAGCFRCFYLWKVVDTYDTSWWAVPQWVCSEIEINLALVRKILPITHIVLHNKPNKLRYLYRYVHV
jgi:hypothetical protein